MTAPVMESSPRARRTKRRLAWWLWALLGAGAIVGIVALLGGFNEVPYKTLPQVQLGEVFVGNEVALQVDDIYLSRTAPVTGYDPAEEGDVFLVVEATAENTTNEPNIFVDRALRVLVEGAISSTDSPAMVADLRTGAFVDFLQPGLPLKVAYLWPVDERFIEPGQEIFLGIFERYAQDDPRFDDYLSEPVAIVRLAETIGEFR